MDDEVLKDEPEEIEDEPPVDDDLEVKKKIPSEEEEVESIDELEELEDVEEPFDDVNPI
ncbi:MAG: hypothetical protein UY47_C0009G0002 [Parcubacteria group bacterium GW2011_GWB1_49_7]|nr:MAG: hypothetical protein UX71_C0002G0251 [Parcubacteria group bacterium GW2011_GWA1_47_10]KKW09604.1 MAG: hypothetical protein UY47_C0009G0002 [Parcubacteria group bacterium GW2011_GWB1_49_7]